MCTYLCIYIYLKLFSYIYLYLYEIIWGIYIHIHISLLESLTQGWNFHIILRGVSLSKPPKGILHTLNMLVCWSNWNHLQIGSSPQVVNPPKTIWKPPTSSLPWELFVFFWQVRTSIHQVNTERFHEHHSHTSILRWCLFANHLFRVPFFVFGGEKNIHSPWRMILGHRFSQKNPVPFCMIFVLNGSQISLSFKHVDGSPVPFGPVIKRKSQWWKTLSEVNSFIFNMSGLYIYHVELSSKIVGIPKGPLGVYPMVQNVPFIQWWSLITSFGSIPYSMFIWGSTI